MDNASKKRLVELAKEADGNVDTLIRNLARISREEGWDKYSLYLSKINREEDELRAAGICITMGC